MTYCRETRDKKNAVRVSVNGLASYIFGTAKNKSINSFHILSWFSSKIGIVSLNMIIDLFLELDYFPLATDHKYSG